MTCRELAALFGGLEDPRDREDGLELLQQFADCAADYVQAVVRMEAALPVFRLTLGAEEYRTRTGELDRRRTACHNALIDATRILNRMLESLGLPPLYGGDLSRRRDVGDFAGAFVREMYDRR